MKKIYLALCLAISAFTITTAQTGNAIVYAEMGEKFTVYLNGEIQNDVPKSNVKMTGLTSEYYKIRIDFEDAKLTDIMENFAVQYGNEATYVVKTNKKGEYICRFQSYAPISGAAANSTVTSQPVDSQTKNYAVVDDQPLQPVETVGNHVNTNTTVKTDTGGVKTGVTVTETTTTTTKAQPANGENINMNMNVDGVNMGINVNMSGMDTQQSSSATAVTSTTTTTTSTTAANTQVEKEQPVREEVVVTGGCSAPMNAANFNSAKESVAAKGFDETRLTLAKQITKSNCLYSSQIKDMMSVFGFEDSKLDFAKYAYDYCFDPNNYYQVNDAFDFESSIEELDKYIGSK